MKKLQWFKENDLIPNKAVFIRHQIFIEYDIETSNFSHWDEFSEYEEIRYLFLVGDSNDY